MICKQFKAIFSKFKYLIQIFYHFRNKLLEKMSMSQGHLPVGRVSWLDNSGWNRLVPKAYPTYYIWCPRLNAHYLIALIGPLILAMNAEGPCSNDLVQRLQSPKMNWNSSIPQIFWPSDPFVVILNSSECLRIKFWYVTSNLINLIILKKIYYQFSAKWRW